MHGNGGEPSRPPRPATRKLVVHHNTFLAHKDVEVGDGSELLTTNGLYPKHDIYVGTGNGMTTTVEIHHNRFLMHEATGSTNEFKPYGRAVRLVGLKGHSALPDDPQPTEGILQVTIGENRYSGNDDSADD